MIIASINQIAFGDNLWLDFSTKVGFQTVQREDNTILIKDQQDHLIGINLLNWSKRLEIKKTQGFISLDSSQITKISQELPQYQDLLDFELASPYFTVGKIKAIEPHPRLERLKIIKVDVGTNKPIRLVSGSINLKLNLLTVVARPGAILPNGKKIFESKIGGVSSPGTLCNRGDLNLPDSKIKGAIEIQDFDIVPGTDFTKVANIKY